MTRTRFALALGTIFLISYASTAESGVRFPIKCNTGGDSFGYSIATGGDWNGDGHDDFVVGAPCLNRNQNKPRAGKIFVYSGRNGALLFGKKGKQTGEWLGAAVAFIGDLDGDGRDEIAMGGPGYDRKLKKHEAGYPDTLVNAGRVRIIRFKKPRRIRVVKGTVKEADLGTTIADLGDVNGDGKRDFGVGAPNDFVTAGGRKGRVYVFSGRQNLALLDVYEGETASAEFGSSLAGGLDMTGDGMPDTLAGSGVIDANNANKSGQIIGFAAPTPAGDFVSVSGAKKDELGSGVAVTDDHNGDGLADFICGSPGSDDLGISRHGTATLFSSTGQVLFNIADPTPEEGGEFGAAVADAGDVNADGVRDFVIGATGTDVPDELLPITRKDGGRIHVVSGVDGTPLWSKDGNFTNGRFGFSVAGGVDINRDGIPDVLAGAVGAAPLGRRGAGSVRVFSGSDGTLLNSFFGRRGLETRIYVAGKEPGDHAFIRAFTVDGVRQEIDAPIFIDRDFGDFSVAILDDRELDSGGFPLPGSVKVAVGTGPRASDSDVVIFDAGRENRVLDQFTAFPELPGVGANVGAGRFVFDEPSQLIAAQGSSVDGSVLVRVFETLFDGTSWFPVNQFQAFRAGEDTAGGLPINAGGGTVAVGNVIGDKSPEVVVGTVSGLPIVRVFSIEGALLAEWFAYEPDVNSGVSLAVVDVDGTAGREEIVTAPRVGIAKIRVFRGEGIQYVAPGKKAPVEFDAYPGFVTNGAVVSSADVDFDGKPEILTIPRDKASTKVKAYELDGSEVIGFDPFFAFPLYGAALSATDTFVRR